MTYTVVWYEYEITLKGQDDWYATTYRNDTIEGLEKAKTVAVPKGYDSRVVRKKLTTEVVNGHGEAPRPAFTAGGC